MDAFGGMPTPAAPAPAAAAALVDPFGAAPAAPVPPTLGGDASNGDDSAAPIIVPAFSYEGLTVEFECTKPEIWNKQRSTLVARFKNTTTAPLYGLNFQCAVPKYVTMEMKPPTSSTIPVTAGNNKLVTQTINVTNSKLGSKNLQLKLKAGFTSNGTKVDHIATCSGFPAGLY